MTKVWHRVTISNHKKVISIIENLSRDRIQLGVSQSKTSILVGLLIGVQKVEISRKIEKFSAFWCSLPSVGAWNFDFWFSCCNTLYTLSWPWVTWQIWLIPNESYGFMSHIGHQNWKTSHHKRVESLLNWFWFVLSFSQSGGRIQVSIRKPTIEIEIGDSYWSANEISQNNIFYSAYSRNVLQPDLVVCNNSCNDF